MKKISDILKDIPLENKDQLLIHRAIDEVVSPRSAHAEQIQFVMILMGEPKLGEKEYSKRYRYWCGRTKHLTTSQIYRLRQSAQDGENPAALFNFLLKKTYFKKQNQ